MKRVTASPVRANARADNRSSTSFNIGAKHDAKTLSGGAGCGSINVAS